MQIDGYSRLRKSILLLDDSFNPDELTSEAIDDALSEFGENTRSLVTDFYALNGRENKPRDLVGKYRMPFTQLIEFKCRILKGLCDILTKYCSKKTEETTDDVFEVDLTKTFSTADKLSFVLSLILLVNSA